MALQEPSLRAQRITGTGLVVCAVAATLSMPAAALFPYGVGVLLFPMLGVLAFMFALSGVLLLRDLRLHVDPLLALVLLLGLNATASLVFLSPELLSAGCEGVYPPRPCGFGIVACQSWIVSAPVAGILLWIGLRRLRLPATRPSSRPGP